MATVVSSIIQPNEGAIKAHLEALFAPCREEYPRGLVELRYGSPSPNQHAYFNLRVDGIAEAAAFAANRNREGANVYIGANPRKPDMDRKRAASDTDVEIAFYQFADLDDEDAVNAAGRRLKALPPSLVVTTGTIPHRRPHFYWLLDEPVRNMPEWVERQRGIAQSLDGDSVINPSRIMRLGGTINWPPQHKLAKGYRVETTSLRDAFNDERPPVTPGQIAQAYPMRATSADFAQVVPAQGQTTLSAMRPTRVADLLAACHSGDQWHNHMVRLVAHLASAGRTTAEILALADNITLGGYTVDQTRREMDAALRGARTKWDIPEPQDNVAAEENTREEADSVFELLDIGELETMPPPRWLIHDMIAEEGLSIVYGEPGTGKSFIALDMALRVSHAMDWHGVKASPCGVLYIAGEGARGLGKRVKGWRIKNDMAGVEAPFLLLPIAVHILDPKHRAKLIRTIDAAALRAGFPIGLIVIDTVSRALAGSDENGQEAMGLFVAACDEVRQFMGGALIGVHHSGKDKDKGMRGSTVLLGACDASIRISKSDRIVTLKTEKQKDAEEAEPIYMEMATVSWAAGLEDEQTTLVPFRSEAGAPRDEDSGLSREQVYEVLKIIDNAWQDGNPLSVFPQAKRSGTFAPSIISQRFGMKVHDASRYLEQWQMNGVIRIEQVSSHTKGKGLKVIDWIMP